MIFTESSKYISIMTSENNPIITPSEVLTCVTDRIINKLECPQDKTIPIFTGCTKQAEKIIQPQKQQYLYHSDQYVRREKKSYRLQPRVSLQQSTLDDESVIKTAPQTFFTSKKSYENVRIPTCELDENDSCSSEIFQYNLTLRNSNQNRKKRKPSIFRSRAYLQEWPSVDNDMIIMAPQRFFMNENSNDDIEFLSYTQNINIFREEPSGFDSSRFPEDHLTLKRANPIHTIDDDTTIPLLKRARPINYEYWNE